MALTGKKKAFADAVLAGKSNKDAAVAAGYSEKTASAAGSRLVKDPDVKAYLDKHRQAPKESGSLPPDEGPKFDLSAADTVAELGYPTRQSLKAWYKDYLEHGEIRPPKRQRDPKFTLEMRQAAVDYYLAHGKSLARTMRKMGYPASREYLCDWIDELAPGQRKYRGPDPRREPVSVEKKVQVIAELEARTGPATEVAEKHGVSRTTPYVWRREIMGDNVGDIEEKGVPVSKEYDDLPDDIEVLQDMLREAKMQLRRVQLELDVREATLEIVKKDPGTDPKRLTNAEKAAVISSLEAPSAAETLIKTLRAEIPGRSIRFPSGTFRSFCVRRYRE